MVEIEKYSTFIIITSPAERRNQIAVPRLPSIANSPANSGGAGDASKEARILLMVRRPVTLTALAVSLLPLTSCAGTGSTSLLGPAYDDPPAAYGYNHWYRPY